MMNRKPPIILILLLLSLVGCSTKTTDNADLEWKSNQYVYESKHSYQDYVVTRFDAEYNTQLKEKYQLEELTKESTSDFETIKIITSWVTNLWEHDGDNTPEQNDPIYILDRVTEDGENYRCVEYALVIAGCLNALDIKTRTLGLKTEDVETREYGAGHLVVEAYSREYNKWVYIDGQWGLIPLYDSTPLNAVQLREMLYNPSDYDGVLTFTYMDREATSAETNQYIEWIKQYLYFIDYTYFDKENNSYSIMLIPTDAEEPKAFQIHYPINIDEYTNSAYDLYTTTK